MGIKAGVVVVTRFCKTGSKTFSGYVDYIDREEAVRNENLHKFNLYNDYMDNPEKTTGLFTSDKESLNPLEKTQLKEEFKMAEENGSLMWQTVISFDNRWLEKYGLYDSELNIVDDRKLKELAAGAIDRMLKNEGLENAVWSGAIHYNTDNVHIHIATVEPFPERPKKMVTVYQDKDKKIPLRDAERNIVKQEEYSGVFKGKSIQMCKKYMVDGIMQQQEQNIAINNIIRGIARYKKQNPIHSDPELREAFLELYKCMPKEGNRGLWNYNSNVMKTRQPLIDKISDMYLQKYHSEEFRDLKIKLAEQDEGYSTAYGKENGRSFERNKIRELYERLGNAILQEVKEYDREIKGIKGEINSTKSKTTGNDSNMNNRREKELNVVGTRGRDRRTMKKIEYALERSLRNLKKSLEKENQQWLNIRRFEDLQREEQHEQTLIQ